MCFCSVLLVDTTIHPLRAIFFVSLTTFLSNQSFNTWIFFFTIVFFRLEDKDQPFLCNLVHLVARKTVKFVVISRSLRRLSTRIKIGEHTWHALLYSFFPKLPLRVLWTQLLVDRFLLHHVFSSYQDHLWSETYKHWKPSFKCFNHGENKTSSRWKDDNVFYYWTKGISLFASGGLEQRGFISTPWKATYLGSIWGLNETFHLRENWRQKMMVEKMGFLPLHCCDGFQFTDEPAIMSKIF